MLPTSYRGSATIEGEHMEAVLRLDDGHVRLAVGNGHLSELLKWPIAGLEVVTTDEGDYLLQAGAQSFTFAPQVDDGLGHEIALRARFATAVGGQEDTDQDISVPHPDIDTPVMPKTVADQVRARGHARRRAGVLTGADLGLRTATIVMAILALTVVAVAAFSGRLGSEPREQVSADPVVTTPSTLPFTEDDVTATSLSGLGTTVPAPADTTPATAPTTTPTTVASTTPTTAAPATTTPPTTNTTAPAVTADMSRVLELTPEEAVAQWDKLAVDLETGLTASNIEVNADSFRFDVGAFVEIRGTAGPDGLVTAVEFIGDPAGTVADDRQVLTALGMTVALVEPSFEPQWRRDLLAELGFNVDNPVLVDLDGSLSYSGINYGIRWDTDLAKLVFSAAQA